MLHLVGHQLRRDSCLLTL